MKRLVFIALVAALLLTGYVVTRPRPEPVPVTFQAPPPTVPIVRWHWDFGDLRAGAESLSRERNPGHLYKAPGHYTVRLRVKGMEEHTAAAGNGPVHALDHALRKALEDFYPNLREMALLDYKVRILDESKATAAKTRVLITSGDGNETWGTVGVADNIIEASWQALVDSIEYKLRRDEKQGKR